MCVAKGEDAGGYMSLGYSSRLCGEVLEGM